MIDNSVCRYNCTHRQINQNQNLEGTNRFNFTWSDPIDWLNSGMNRPHGGSMDRVLWNREAVGQVIKHWGVGVLSSDTDVDMGWGYRSQTLPISRCHLQFVDLLLQRQGGHQIDTTCERVVKKYSGRCNFSKNFLYQALKKIKCYALMKLISRKNNYSGTCSTGLYKIDLRTRD